MSLVSAAARCRFPADLSAFSILTSDFYGLCFGLGLFGYRPYWLYFVAYPLVLAGLVVYFFVGRPEATGKSLRLLLPRSRLTSRISQTWRSLPVESRPPSRRLLVARLSSATAAFRKE